MKKNAIKKILATALVTIMALAMTAIAFADINNDSFTWYQTSGGSYVTNSTTIIPGSNINTSGIEVFLVATSPTGTSGTFTVTLQKQNWLGGWSDVKSWTANQSHATKYNNMTGTYVVGEPSLFLYSTTASGTYRIKLSNPSNPQQVQISYFYLFGY